MYQVIKIVFLGLVALLTGWFNPVGATAIDLSSDDELTVYKITLDQRLSVAELPGLSPPENPTILSNTPYQFQRTGQKTYACAAVKTFSGDLEIIEAWKKLDDGKRGGNDLLAREAELVNAWKKMDQLGADEALRRNPGALEALAKKDAGEVVPDPSTYLDADYIATHLAKFDDGASYLVPKSALDRFGRNPVGRPDGQFTLPKSELDEILNKANGDLSIVEKELGIPPGSWSGQELVRIDIPNAKGSNARLPSGNEGGANELWIPGGKTSGGISEAVLDPIPQGSYTETLTNLK